MTSRTRSFGHHISILFRAPLRDLTGVPPFMVYGIDNPATGGVLIPAGAGDAAHVFTPVSGMGLNLALHDATVAARCLAGAIRHGRDEVLDQYEAACKPLAEDLLALELATT